VVTFEPAVGTGPCTATATANPDDSISVMVPLCAASGLLSVSNFDGSTASAQAFTVLASPGGPTISGFTPAGGPAGTVVTISGSDLAPGGTGPTPTVAFGASSCSTTADINGDGSLNAVVPVCAVTGPITVSNVDGSATSNQSYVVV
jgi:hypothetical protein